MQRLFDKLIGYMRAVEVAGVDIGDTEPNNLAVLVAIPAGSSFLWSRNGAVA
jgi:hypothetical protein